MAALGTCEQPSLSNKKRSDITQGTMNDDDEFDCSQRAQLLRAVVLGANDGLVSIASLMMGVGAVKDDTKSMVLTGIAGLVAGACSMAIGEFVSVYTQKDVELAQRARRVRKNAGHEEETTNQRLKLPNPVQAAIASAFAFTIGGVVPLLAAAFIRRQHTLRLAVVAAAASLALSLVSVLIGGWMAMAITFGLTKLIGTTGL
ncbi:hypothetical protein ES319_D03G112100v1 [Gossypium barbadense]|uniref:Vacuolar iron transporter n=1 Tax=Gossypium barbadense TaxID=3634 RepID=A0A5J5S2V8_GOSBA|nr:hypothetical protein ES319_D03G112100v1 [Gossypium barbadense]